MIKITVVLIDIIRSKFGDILLCSFELATNMTIYVVNFSESSNSDVHIIY